MVTAIIPIIAASHSSTQMLLNSENHCGGTVSGWVVLMAMLFTLYLFVFILGALESQLEDSYEYGSPVSYVFFPYGIGFKFGKWFFKHASKR